MNLLLQLRSGAPSSPGRSGPSGGHNSKRALAAWRAMMDKLIDLIMFAEVQSRMGDWFTGSLLPAWLPSAPVPVGWEPSTPREAVQEDGHQGGRLQAMGVFRQGPGFASPEVQGGAGGDHSGLRPSSRASSRSWEWSQSGRLLCKVPRPVGRQRNGGVPGRGSSTRRCSHGWPGGGRHTSLLVRQPRSALGDQEARAHSRPSFLEVRRAGVPILRLGPRRNREAAGREAQGDEQGGERPEGLHRGPPGPDCEQSGGVRADLANATGTVRDCSGSDSAAHGECGESGPDGVRPQGPEEGPNSPKTVDLASPKLRRKWRAMAARREDKPGAGPRCHQWLLVASFAELGGRCM